MRDLAYDAATTRPGPLEVSFTFQPANDRSNGKHPDPSVEPGNVPRISRLMALAIRFDGLVRRGEVRDYADLARLGLRDAGPDHADHEPAQPRARHSGGVALPASHTNGTRSHPGERRPSHHSCPALEPPARDVGATRRPAGEVAAPFRTRRDIVPRPPLSRISPAFPARRRFAIDLISMMSYHTCPKSVFSLDSIFGQCNLDFSLPEGIV